VVVLALGALVAGCGGENLPQGREKHSVKTTAEPAPATATPTAPPQPAPPVPAAARRQSAALPLDQRVGQLFVAGFEGVDLQAPVFGELAGHGWGGVAISLDNAPTPDIAATMAGEAGLAATNAGRVKPLVVADPELGDVAGATFTLGPHADVPGTGGPDTAQATRIARRAVREWKASGVIPAIGHFPGQGTASQDPIDGPAQVGLPLADLERRDLEPFAAVASRAPLLIVSSATFLAFDPLTPAAQLPAITRDLLRGELQFGGVAMSDDLGGLQAATGQDAGAAAIAAIGAGIDLIYVPDPASAAEAYRAVLAAVKAGDLSAARVRDAAARVLAMKSIGAPPAPDGTPRASVAPPAPSPE
jgi:beta-N-acetylhexosaminidase